MVQCKTTDRRLTIEHHDLKLCEIWEESCFTDGLKSMDERGPVQDLNILLLANLPYDHIFAGEERDSPSRKKARLVLQE